MGETRTEVLQHTARKRLLRALLDADGSADISTLASEQAAAMDTNFVQAVAACHDLHLPKLEAAGLIESPKGETRVELSVEPECARRLLQEAT